MASTLFFFVGFWYLFYVKSILNGVRNKRYKGDREQKLSHFSILPNDNKTLLVWLCGLYKYAVKYAQNGDVRYHVSFKERLTFLHVNNSFNNFLMIQYVVCCKAKHLSLSNKPSFSGFNPNFPIFIGKPYYRSYLIVVIIFSS